MNDRPKFQISVANANKHLPGWQSGASNDVWFLGERWKMSGWEISAADVDTVTVEMQRLVEIPIGQLIDDSSSLPLGTQVRIINWASDSFDLRGCTGTIVGQQQGSRMYHVRIDRIPDECTLRNIHGSVFWFAHPHLEPLREEK